MRVDLLARINTKIDSLERPSSFSAPVFTSPPPPSSAPLPLGDIGNGRITPDHGKTPKRTSSTSSKSKLPTSPVRLFRRVRAGSKSQAQTQQELPIPQKRGRGRSNTTTSTTSSTAPSASSHSNQSNSKSRPPSRTTLNRSSLDVDYLNRASAQAAASLRQALAEIEVRYEIAWECAELLVELGSAPMADGGKVGESMSAPGGLDTQGKARSPLLGSRTSIVREGSRTSLVVEKSDSAPALSIHLAEDPTSRSHPGTVHSRTTTTATASTDETMRPPIPISHRHSSGRNDLSARQLVLLRDMLNYSATSGDLDAVGVVNRGWKWGAGESTVTLPSTEESHGGGDGEEIGGVERRRSTKGKEMALKKVRSREVSGEKLHSRGRIGLGALRDVLRGFKKQQQHGKEKERRKVHGLPTPSQSSVEVSSPPLPLSARSPPLASSDNVAIPPRIPPQQLLPHRASPRRPSLANIFRFSKRGESSTSVGDQSSRSASHNNSENRRSRDLDAPSSDEPEEDWDHLDSSTDDVLLGPPLSGKGDMMGTVRASTQGRSPYLHAHAGSSNIFGERERLSAVLEASPSGGGGGNAGLGIGIGSVGSEAMTMTPENIAPLLDSAKEVRVRLTECLREMGGLLDGGDAS